MTHLALATRGTGDSKSARGSETPKRITADTGKGHLLVAAGREAIAKGIEVKGGNGRPMSSAFRDRVAPVGSRGPAVTFGAPPRSPCHVASSPCPPTAPTIPPLGLWVLLGGSGIGGQVRAPFFELRVSKTPYTTGNKNG